MRISTPTFRLSLRMPVLLTGFVSCHAGIVLIPQYIYISQILSSSQLFCILSAEGAFSIYGFRNWQHTSPGVSKWISSVSQMMSKPTIVRLRFAFLFQHNGYVVLRICCTGKTLRQLTWQWTVSSTDEKSQWKFRTKSKVRNIKYAETCFTPV